MITLFKTNKQSPEKELKTLLDGYEVPSFPANIMTILSMLRDAEASLDEISMHIEMDPGLHVRLLKTVNSAAFGLSSSVANIPHSVTLLGRSRVESLVLSVAVKDSLSAQQLDGFDNQHFWLTSAKRASLARALARKLHPATQPECFSAGLLQDVAVPVLASVKKDEYNSLYSEWRNNSDTRLDIIEKEKFQYDHASIGALMIQQWDLPEFLGSMIMGHHDHTLSEHVEPAVRLVSHIRDSEENDGVDHLIEACSSEFSIPADELSKMTEVAMNDANEFAALLE